MSRLILRPELVLTGVDPATSYEVTYRSESGTLAVGCESHSLREWKKRGADIIRNKVGGWVCDNPRCTLCGPRPSTKARKLLLRLKKLIAHIEGAEAALKKSLRAQTKRA